MNNEFFKFNGAGYLLITLVSLLTVLTYNPMFTFISVISAPVLITLLWRKDEPPVLFFAMLQQLVSVSIKVFYADFLGEPFNYLHENPENIEYAFISGIVGILTISVGIHLAIRKIPAQNDTLTSIIQRYSPKKITLSYGAFAILSPVLILLAYSVPGVQQFFYKILELRWSFLFILYISLRKENFNIHVFYIIASIELLLGFSGYFSTFKDYIFAIIICYFTINQKFKPIQIIPFTFIALIILYSGIIWQTIKPSYREFLAQGQITQASQVSTSDALGELTVLIEDMDTEKHQEGFESLINRISYIDLFSATISYVPSAVPHEQGSLWKNAIVHIVQPRILFSEKEILDDSEKARKYTGLNFAGMESATSIGIGYMAESYVDFGLFFMHFPLFLFGVLIGLTYKFILENSFNKLWGYAFVLPIFFNINTFETALDKMFGGLIMYLLIVIIANKFIVTKIDKLIRS